MGGRRIRRGTTLLIVQLPRRARVDHRRRWCWPDRGCRVRPRCAATSTRSSSDCSQGAPEGVDGLTHRAGMGRGGADAVSFVDARLPDESRAHAVLGCLGSPGTCISLRVPAQRTLSLQDCVASGSLTPGGAQLLTPMIEAKLAFLISGGTGSGTPPLASYLGREGISRSSPGRGSKLVQAQSLCAPS
jgi:hypothetical protein